MSHPVILFTIVTALFYYVHGSPSIDTVSVNVTKSVGEQATLICHVKDITTETVTWTHLEHNKVITKGDKLVVDNVHHYKLEIPQGDFDDGNMVYILHIMGITKEDAGFYKCEVMSNNASVTHQLIVNGGTPIPTPPTTHNYNFTDCCVKKQVSSLCQPVCDPMTPLPSQFDPVISCAADLSKLLECGSDGKNHVPCCKRRGLPDQCFDFCLGSVPQSLDVQHMECLNRSMDIIMCYEEGQDILPGPPTSVSAVAQLDPVGFVVRWRAPVSNKDQVQGYYIHYKISADTVYRTSIPIDANMNTFRITGLMPNKIYTIYVSAYSKHGSSQPSEKITQPTIGGKPPVEQDRNIAECCSKQQISSKCQASLCKSNIFEDLDPGVVFDCYGFLDEALKCVSGHRDHTGCCQRNGIPDICLGFCSGNVPALNGSLAQCMFRLPMIEACIQEGLVTLPGPPENVNLTNVTHTTALVEWSAPNNSTVKRYVVYYLEHEREGKSPRNKNITENTNILLTDLTPNTLYDVTIISENDAGQSLPSSTIGFLTYADAPTSPPATPSPGPVLPYDLQACCQKNGVQNSCMILCDYGFIINSSASDLFTAVLPCMDAFYTIVTCGSDGRDHTQCCAERNVNRNCYSACKGDVSSVDFTCALETPKITQCFTEGIIDLPRPPNNVYIEKVTAHTVTVSWSPPNTGPAATSYYVMCDGCNGKKEFKKRTKMMSFILQNLDSDFTYKISVISENSEGYSIPSPAMSVFLPSDKHHYNCSDSYTKYPKKAVDKDNVYKTLIIKNNTIEDCKTKCKNMTMDGRCTGFNYDGTDCELVIGMYGQKQDKDGTDFYGRQCDFHLLDIPLINGSSHISWKTQQECCQSHNVSDSCLPFCESGDVFSDLQKCENDFPTTVSCSADGRNHTDCCRQAGVPDSCLPFCWGDVMDKDHPTTQLCLSYTRMFITCFNQGERTIPSTPRKFRVTSTGPTSVNVAWEIPDLNCDPISNCKYVFQYHQENDMDTKFVQESYSTSSTQKNLTTLQPETTYYMTMTAVNKYGSSLPTPWVTFRTPPVESFAANFYKRPNAVIDTGSPVTIICEVFGAPQATIEIKFKTKVISTSRVYTIPSAAEANDGEYTCEIQKTLSDNERVVKKLQLMVRYKPKMLRVIDDAVEPGTGQTAYLKCIFEGLPMQTKWTKGGGRVPSSTFTSTSVVFHADGQVTDSLIIHNVREEMYGQYECVGINDFGNATGHVHLRNKFNPPPNPPRPTIPPRPANETLNECCVQNGVSGVCLDLCNYNTDFSAITDNKYDTCIRLLPVFVTCAADKKDHTRCCDSKGVIQQCQSYCKGTTPDMSDVNALLICIGDSASIMECLEQGKATIPSPPKNVRAVQVDDVIEVRWDPPIDNGAPITKYDIRYNTSQNSKVEMITVSDSVSHTNIASIPPDAEGWTYYVSVSAGNTQGDSHPANAQPVILTKMPPPAPTNLLGKVDGTVIMLQWNPPSYQKNIASYVVKYKISAENRIPQESTVLGATTGKAKLSDLAPNSLYEIFVVARSADNVDGKKSNTITIRTGNSISVTDSGKQRKDGSGPSGGVVAVIIILVLVIAGAVVAGVLYYRRRNRHRFSEAVTFENPQYGSHDSQIKISGLPTDGSDDNPFGYSPLHEDRDDHQYSSPMLNVDQVEFKPRK